MKKFFALLLCLSVMTVATACGSKEEPAESADTQVEETQMAEDAAQDETAQEPVEDAAAETETQDAAEEAQEATVTGTLEDKKDFMVTVTADEGQTYAFNLADGVVCDAEVGDTVTVTYTGDIEAPEADQDLTATMIVAAQ